MVQQELHPSDEGREEHGDSGEPRTNEAASGVPEIVDTPNAGAAFETLPAVPFTALEIVPTLPVGEVEATAASPTTFVEIGEAAPGRLVAAGGAMVMLNVWKDEVIAWFKTLASAAVYATLIVTFGFQVARVEGQSMAPTLEDQDRLIVNKLAYRMGEPSRGDIVMLYYPINPDKSFVKRVIAEEGDEVRIADGRVFVKTPSGYEVQLADDFVPPEFRSHEDFGPELVKDGYYFVMGDHRNNSSDSRHWGQVPKKYIIGKVQLRWWPIPNARVF